MKTPTELVDGAGGPAAEPVEPRVSLSLVRCAEVCSAPESLPGGRVCYRTMTDRSAKLLWDAPPRNVLIVKKWHDKAATEYALGLAHWLATGKRMRVWMTAEEDLPPYVQRYSEQVGDAVDLGITVGGDGTVLFFSSLFQGSCPPLVSIAFGSLGFLTAVNPTDGRAVLEAVLSEGREGFEFTPRSRVRVDVYRDGASSPEHSLQGLNELIVDRGSSPYMTALDAFIDDEYLTTVQADGILCATPTGSTAYSLSAGGSILFPTVPALLFTPICPHSLSFRPVMFPDSSVITLSVPKTARCEPPLCDCVAVQYARECLR